jgi:hypothetical protein
MSNTENPNVESPELELEDEGDTDLKVRTNLKAGLTDPNIYSANLLAPKISRIDPLISTTTSIKSY